MPFPFGPHGGRSGCSFWGFSRAWLSGLVGFSIACSRNPSQPQQAFRQAELPFTQLLPASSKQEGDYTVAFLSEERLALLVGSGVCRLWVLQRVGQQLLPVAETGSCGASPRLSAVGGNQILVSF